MPARNATTPIIRQKVQAGTAKSTASYVLDAMILALGFLSPFTVRVVGTLPITELILVVIGPLLFVINRRQLKGKKYGKAFLLIAVWLAAQIVTDFYRQTDRISWMKGQANIGFFLLDCVCLALLLSASTARKVFFFSAFSAGFITATYLQPSEIQLEAPWKFGYSLPVTILGLLLCSAFYRARAYPAMLAPIGLIGLLDLTLNFRSGLLFLLITTVLTVPIVPERIGRLRVLPQRGTAARVFVLACLALCAGGAALLAVRIATQSGYVGEEAQKKNLEQFQSGSGLLLTARPEIFVSSRAVMDSPILGHGSWARDPKYTEMLNDINRRNGMTSDLSYMEEQSRGLIPSHSHLMGAWVNAGILGALFWAYIFWVTLKAIIAVAKKNPGLSPFYYWLLVGLLFDILFSPFGSVIRIKEAATLVIILDLVNDNRDADPGAPIQSRFRWTRKIRRTIRDSAMQRAI